MAKLYYVQDQSGNVFEMVNPEHCEGCKQLSQAEGKRLMHLQAIEKVKAMLLGVDTIYGIVRSVGASGVSRRIDMYVIIDNKLQYLSGYAAKVLGWKLSDKGGIVVRGCGMDMMFHTGSTLVESCGLDYKAFRYEVI